MRIFYILITLFLSACTLYKTPVVPEVEAPEKFKVSIKTVHSDLQNEWWKNFDNSQLNKLVELGIKNNYDYKIAIKNIEIAQTYVSQNFSYLFPQVSSSLGGSRNKIVPSEFFNVFTPATPPGTNVNDSVGTNATTTTPGFSGIFDVAILSAAATYEVDIWNKIRNSVKQAEANEAASYANSNVVKLTLISSLVNTYFQIMALNTNIENLKQQHEAVKEIGELAQVQFKAGLSSESPVHTAKIQEKGILSSIATSEKQKQILVYTLAYLVGEYPENFSIEPKGSLNNLHFTQLIPEGIPSEMIALRPDIQGAYYQIMSYGYLEKQNIANFLPSLSITGLYGYANSTFANLIGNSNAFWSYNFGVSETLFDYAIRMSEYKRSKFQFESAIFSYKDTVINAFTEVNSALVSYEEDNEALNAIEQQYIHARKLLNLADAQYQAGLTNYTTYLSTDLNFLQSEYNVTSQQLLVIQDIIQVYKTLGLGLGLDLQTGQELD